MAEPGEGRHPWRVNDGRRRGRRWALLVPVALGVVAVGLAIVERRAIAEWTLLDQLRRLGIDAASLRVEEVGPGGLAIRDVRIGEGDLALQVLDLEWSMAALAARRLDGLRIRGLRVRGSLGEGGVRLGALDVLRGGDVEAPKGPPRFPVLPTARLEILEASFTLETGEGPYMATLAVHLDEAGDGRVALAATALPTLETALGIAAEPFAVGGTVAFRPDRFHLALDPARFSLTLADEVGAQRIRGETPAITLSAEPGGAETLRIATAGGEVSLPDAGVAIQGLLLEAHLDAASGLPSGSLVVEAARDTSETPRFPTVGLRADFSPEDGSVAFAGALTGLDGRLSLTFQGAHDPARDGGRADLALVPLVLETGKLAPKDVLPLLAPLLQGADGTVEASGEINWSGREADGFVDFGVRDLTLQTGAARIERVNAAVRVDGPWPPRIPAGQLVSMARLDFGLELTNGLVRYALRENGVLMIEAAEWEFAGGTIRSGGALDFAAEEQRITLTVRDVELAELLTLVNLEGLSGSGQLNGALPIYLRGDSIEIRNAVLEAPSSGGWIHYTPLGEAGAVAGAAGLAFGDLLEALRNFRYERLSLTVNGHAEGDVVVALSLLGANPEHRDGQPYEFNLNVDGRLADLVRQSGAAYQIPAQIEEQLGKIAGETR